MGDPDAAYRYSGRTFVPHSWHPAVAALRDRLEETVGRRFNTVLLSKLRLFRKARR